MVERHEWLFAMSALVAFVAPPRFQDPGKDPQKAKVDERKDVVEVAPVVVTPTRGDDGLLDVPQAVSVVDQKKIGRLMPQNTPDALREEPGLVIQNSNQGGGSPILRGRSGKDVLLLIDGQRFSNSTFRRNHQYMSTVDSFALERIEVTRGPASVLYGSDAMGGAINMLLHQTALDGVNGFGGRIHTQYDSVNDGWTNRVEGDAEIDGWGAFAGMTWRHFGDLEPGRVGSNPIYPVDVDGEQVPTGYREQAANVAITRQVTEHDAIDFALLYARQFNVPTSERIIPNEKEPNPADQSRDTDPQRLRWWEMRWRHEDRGSTVETAQAIVSLNAPVEGRRRVRNSTPDVLTVERDEIVAPGVSLQTGIRWDETHLLTVGGEAYFESIESESNTFDSTTGQWTKNPTGRYPDGSDYDTFGVFLQDEWHFADDWEWVNGLRYSRISVDLDFDGLTVGTVGPFDEFDEVYEDVTFATGLVRHLDEATSFYASISRGFRAPNLDDLAVVGDFAAGNRIPNFDLDPETVMNYEIGGNHYTPERRAGMAIAYANYQDLFTNQFAFTLAGEDYFVVDNADRAGIWSGELWIDEQLFLDDCRNRHSAFFQAFASFGRNYTADEPVSKIAPPEGMLGYRIESAPPQVVANPAAGTTTGTSTGADWFGANWPWSCETFARGALAQRRLAEADKADPRFPNSGTPAWWTLNFRASANVAPNVWVTAGVENIFNYRYRSHGSGIDAPGRNLFVGIDLRF